MYSENSNMPTDPYSQDYTEPAPASAAASGRGRSRSRSPAREANGNGFRSPRRKSPVPKRPAHAPIAPNPSNVLGVFGLSIRSQERDIDEEFSRFGRVEKVTIVYDQRSDRSRGFGFIRMATVEDATRCIQELNGVELNGRRIRVDYSVTDRPHAPTPGEYMGHRRSARDSRYGDRDRDRDRYSDRDRDSGRDREHRDRDSYRDRDSRDSWRKDRGDRDRDRDRDHYGRDSRDSRESWKDKRGSPTRGRYSPDYGGKDYRRRRSYSRSPPRGSSPVRPPADRAASGSGAAFEAPMATDARW